MSVFTQGKLSAEEMTTLSNRIDKLDDELLMSLDKMLSSQGDLVKNDAIADALVNALVRAYAAAPDVNVVLVLNSCTSSHIYDKMVKIAETKIHPQHASQCCVISTTKQWPGSILPRFLQTMLLSARGGVQNRDQLEMISELAETLEKSVESYAEIECEGQSEDNINAMEYANAVSIAFL